MKVSLVDYIGYSDHTGVPVGHPLKVIKEFRDLIGTEMETEIVAPANYLEALNEPNGKTLPLKVDAIKSGKNTFENIKCMLISFINIHMALRKASADTVWFCNVDQFLFMYLGLFGFHKKKIAVTIFAQKYHKSYHNYFLNKVLPRLSLIVSSNPEVSYPEYRSISIPDYLYKREYYAAYRAEKKQEKVVCVGTMNRSKQIKELVEIWNEIDYPLEICGLFYEPSYLQEIMQIKKPHITIRNQYLEYEEYLKILGSARYSILPYRQSAYANFTSGVILESIFLGTVPITCRMLLEKMKIAGISYVEMEELKKVDLQQISSEEFRAENEKIIAERFDERIYRDKIRQLLKQI